jgi:hypothetical protein
MNRPGIVGGGVIGGIALGISLTMALGSLQTASAQVAFPKFARSYIAYMARAMDQCSATTLTVSAPPNLPTDGCLQTNAVTDDQLTMGWARVYLRETGRIIVVGDWFDPNPASVQLQMTLRVTRKGVTTNMGVQTVTFPDLTVQCPTVIPSQPDGSIYSILQLSDCLGAGAGGLATGTSNIEVVDLALLNVSNGNEAFGNPGLLR